VRRHQHDFVECERGTRGIRCIEMTDVNGVEGTTE
jgi:hypothetical protein